MAQVGDIAIVGYGADAGIKSFSFVILADLSGETINFTDSGWLATGGFRVGEGVVPYVVPAGTAIGTVVTISGLTSAFNPSTNGDQIIAYSGDAATPTPLFAIDFADGNANYADTASNANTSAVPTGLIFGETALAFAADNAAYSGPLDGTRAEILANIANAGLWTQDDAFGIAYPVGFSVTSGDGAGSFAIADASVQEGNTGTTAIEFVVQRSGGSAGAATLDYVVIIGTAGQDDLAGAFTGQVSFADGQTEARVTIAANGDTTFEADETFSVTLSNASMGTISDAQATGTILNDDAAPPVGTFSIADASVAEGNAGITQMTFTVTRADSSTGAVDLSYAIALDGSADAADLDAAAGTVRFEDGQTSQTVTIAVNGDLLVEGDETFGITLSTTATGATIADGSAVGTILNDDVPGPAGTLSVADAAAFEGASGITALTFTVTRDGGSSGAASASYMVMLNGTASTDDLAAQTLSGTVEFADGATSATIIVQVAGDAQFEGDETFGVTLSAPVGAALGDASAVGTIRNDDAPGVFINEIHYDDAGTDAGEGVEVAGIAGTDLTGWSLVFYNGNGGGVYATQALSGVIANQDDGYGTLSFAGPAGGIQNGAPDAIALVAPGAQVVQFLSYEGTVVATGGAATGLTSTDIGVAEEGVADGFSLQLTGDGSNYSDFTWAAAQQNTFGQLNTGQNFLSANAPGVVRIGDASVVEGNAGSAQLVFTATRAGGGASTASVEYFLNLTGSADSNDLAPDTALSGTVTFAEGVSSQRIVIDILGDVSGEFNETLNVRLANPLGNISIADDIAVGTIVNDDPLSLEIYDIQGAGHRSEYVGQVVTTGGIVTAVDNNGFYIQAAMGDGNTATSDAVLVFTGTRPTVAIGDRLNVTGTVAEFVGGVGALSLTQITAPTTISVVSQNNALPDAVMIGVGGRLAPSEVIDDDGLTSFDPDLDGLDFYESMEGMRVTVDRPQVVAATNSFGETFVVASGGEGATGMNARGGITLSEGDNNPERLQIDADSDLFAGYAPGHTQGDQLGNVTGIMNYAFSTYEVLVTEAVSVVTDAPLPTRETTELVGGADQVSIGSFNVENLDPGDGAAKFTLIAEEILYALQAPDIIGLQEIQDADGAGNGSDLSGAATAQVLIDAIVAIGGARYSYVEVTPASPNSTGGEPGGNIRNGFLYNSDRVGYIADSAVAVPGSAYAGTRSPLAADFSFNGQTVTAINVHFTSRGGSDGFFGDTQPPFQAGDGARTAQNTQLRAYVDGLLAADPALNIAVLGDFNGYYYEDGQRALTAGGVLTNLYDLLPEEERYSYLFEGNVQAFDNILVSGGLASGAAFDVVHYNSEQPDSAGRATDHDQVVAVLNVPRNPGSLGNDVLTGTTGADVLSGLAGNDVLTGLEGNDTLVGGEGVDTLFGNQGNDALSGGAGNDTLYGGQDDDQLRGDAGDDVLEGGRGDDLVDGGEGIDTASYSNASGVTVDLRLSGSAQNTTGAGVDTLVAIENLIGSGFDDVLIGDAGENVLSGGFGNDRLAGGGGNDELFGNQGNDMLEGGSGVNALYGGQGDDMLIGGESRDYLEGGKGDDSISGGGDSDTAGYFNATQGVTVSLLQQGVAQATGGAGTDTLFDIENLSGSRFGDVMTGDGVGNSIDGGDGDDLLTGGFGIDFLTGGTGSDTLFGNQDMDVLDGGDGNDFLYGGRDGDFIIAGSGDDLLQGGLNSDVLFGGAGADTFRYVLQGDSVANDTDNIQDFQSGVDRVDLTGLANAQSVFTFTNSEFDTALDIDLGGDGVFDMQILFNGQNAIVLSDIVFG
ncbi:Calx-beta domain-containing protein [Sphingomonas montana]|uniref:Calx-beta domain-containing protein n=1 Tax=Sphingomonas montana TaxID=1843236 RepID=UPI00096EB34D|nr:Calx-beta domain-containing protein [Sphingomonas montana]